MSTALLSLLLLVLVGMGLVMGAKLQETFANPPADAPKQKVSPAVYNIQLTADLIEEANNRPVQYDKLTRDRDAADAVNAASLKAEQEEKENRRCPECPTCPDMSQYVKLSEVPCWNCTLP
jgi:hypothetical protein